MRRDGALWASLLSLMGVLMGVAASHGLYLALVVPALQHVRAVPLLWWLGLATPLMAAIFLAGRRARTLGATLAVAGGAVLVVIGYEAAGTALEVRPFSKGTVADAFWSARTLLGAIVTLGIATVGHLTRARFSRGEDDG